MRPSSRSSRFISNKEGNLAPEREREGGREKEKSSRRDGELGAVFAGHLSFASFDGGDADSEARCRRRRLLSNLRRANSSSGLPFKAV